MVNINIKIHWRFYNNYSNTLRLLLLAGTNVGGLQCLAGINFKRLKKD